MPWVKAFHIVFVVAWFAGLLYLPRLFVYHSMTDDEAGRARFATMERKLYRLMTVAGAGAIAFGVWLLGGWWDAFAAAGWLHLKLALVAGLLVYHAICGRMVRRFAERANSRSHVFYRWFNEIPALLLIAISILAVVKPF